MKKRVISIIIAALLFNGCKKDEGKPLISESKILGNWSVVDEADQRITVEWGLFYVSSTKLYADKSFKVNIGTGIDENTSKTGTWLLNENIDSITFYSEVNDLGTIYRDTTKFNISFDANERLILRNSTITITHLRLNN